MQVLLWVAALSLLSAAAVMGVVAWRTTRGVRERESARAELLRALAFPDGSTLPASGPSHVDWADEFGSEDRAALAIDTYAPAGMFAGNAEPVTASRRWIALAGVGAAMVVVITLYALIAGGRAASGATPSPTARTTKAPPAAAATAPTATAAAAPAAPAAVNAATAAAVDVPIELIALHHRIGGAAAFDVSGVVRNPAEGRPLPQLVAVVDLFDANDRVITTGRQPLDQAVLEAGQTSAFSLVFPRVTGTIARYRVEFRSHGRDAVPHVDRRAAEPGTKARSF
jgi:hypothetical protein